jgi:site-specific DNA-methyltransferase (adenine-specific)
MTQDATKSTYTWVPQQTWDRTWTDAELYKKYGITKDEQAYIETMIKEMQP